VRKLSIVLVPVLLIAALAGTGVWLSEREESAAAPGTLVAQPVDGLLVGRSTDVRVPWGRLQVTMTEPVDTVEGEDGTLHGTFVGIQVELRDTEDAVPVDRLPDATFEDPQFSLVADGDSWELPALGGWADGTEVDPGARRQYVAVPGDADEVDLAMTYDGVTQTIDVATADVTIGDAAPLYDAPFPAPGAPCGDQLWSTGTGPVEDAASGCFVLSSATRPYVAGLGWAGEGSRWLVVRVVPGAPTSFTSRGGTYEAGADDLETSYALGFEEPVEVYAANDVLPDSVGPDPLDPQVVVFEVPEDRGTGQMDVRTSLRGTLVETGRGAGKGNDRAGRTPRTARALVVQGAFV
jgi:hypothetical protein